MTKREHPNAKWLRALADGEELETRGCDGFWRSATTAQLRLLVSQPEDAVWCWGWRIKPEEPTWDEVARYMNGWPVFTVEFVLGTIYVTPGVGADTRANILRDFRGRFEAAKQKIMKEST